MFAFTVILIGNVMVMAPGTTCLYRHTITDNCPADGGLIRKNTMERKNTVPNTPPL